MEMHITSQDSPKVPSEFLNQIITGDAVQVMRKLPDASVDLIITSPPYNLKNSTGNGMKYSSGGKCGDYCSLEC